MKVKHGDGRPVVDPSAYVAPNTVLSGDVHVAANSAILYGPVLSTEGGPIRIGSRCAVMEQAVIRASSRHPTSIGNHVLIGPRAYVRARKWATRRLLSRFDRTVRPLRGRSI